MQYLTHQLRCRNYSRHLMLFRENVIGCVQSSLVVDGVLYIGVQVQAETNLRAAGGIQHPIAAGSLSYNKVNASTTLNLWLAATGVIAAQT
jgi:hypothetical protein